LFTFIKEVLLFFEKDILHLKSFSLTSHDHNPGYDSQIVPLLRRMIYLEELLLNLSVINRSTFIDGIHLKNDVVDHMPQLQTFRFNIITRTHVQTDVNHQLYEDIRCTFLSREFHQVNFYLDQYSDGLARSHIYSLPYQMNVMRDLSRNFPGGLFTNVRVASLIDRFYRFGDPIFDRIARSFPFLTDLTIFNTKRRNYRSSDEAEKNNPMPSIIVFPHLTHLDICLGGIYIAEQLLVDTNTLLPRLTHLTIFYSKLEEVTENFTREATRRNCANIKYFDLTAKPIVHGQDFYSYFPCYK
jgi:hypothetical protein